MRNLLFIRPMFEAKTMNPNLEGDLKFTPVPGEYILGAQLTRDHVAEELVRLQSSLAEKCIELSIIEPGNSLVDSEPWEYAGIKSGNGRMVPGEQLARIADLNDPPISTDNIVRFVADTANETNCMSLYRGVIDMVYGESYAIDEPRVPASSATVE